MNDFKVGDKVRATGSLQPVVLYEGTIIEVKPLGNVQMCLIEIAEGSGFWSHVKMDAITSDCLEKLDPKQ